MLCFCPSSCVSPTLLCMWLNSSTTCLLVWICVTCYSRAYQIILCNAVWFVCNFHQFYSLLLLHYCPRHVIWKMWNNNYRFHDLIGGIHVPVDDGVDKLNRKYTLLVFLFLALPIFTKQYIGDPIECFTPTYFTEPQARYVNSYCWTASTYYLVSADAEDEDYEGFTGQVSEQKLLFTSMSQWTGRIQRNAFNQLQSSISIHL